MSYNPFVFYGFKKNIQNKNLLKKLLKNMDCSCLETFGNQKRAKTSNFSETIKNTIHNDINKLIFMF